MALMIRHCDRCHCHEETQQLEQAVTEALTCLQRVLLSSTDYALCTQAAAAILTYAAAVQSSAAPRRKVNVHVKGVHSAKDIQYDTSASNDALF